MTSGNRWAILLEFAIILLFAGAADGLMDALGCIGFLIVGLAVMGAARALAEVSNA